MSSEAFSATGNQMVADAFRQADPDVMAAYPITPQTTIVENYAKFVANGQVHTEFVTVESEHSAMSACIGASAAGGRVATATSSQGLALMWEELHIAAGMRCPIVMANANRAISAPINIHGDHSDIMGTRDTGWIILFAETAQEAYDNSIIAFKVAEDPRVLLPVMTTLDGFVTTHAMDRCVLEDDQTVAKFIGQYHPLYPLLDTDHPVAQGMFANLGNSFMKAKLQVRRTIEGSLDVIKEAGQSWSDICGRPFDIVDSWGTEDADYLIVALGSMAGNARHTARMLRAEGKKVGVVRPRVFRPFPAKEIAQACSHAKRIAVFDRSDSLGAQFAPLGAEVATSLYNEGLSIPVSNYVVGLGGADVTIDEIKSVYSDLADGTGSGTISYLGIQE
ncbi:MAG: pyruvate ferredoxin oxidoreductase [Eggerthellaceae bacterium]|jgi:pyruvate ferredoxin oxidoreductase alpha subunit|nr:pyruvate ferredoxin oxidoreductase [Eggerthellaceae bacterium]MCH4220780.1 pyruvate ferredoxin oxidoreductase [Eggerthellaceae bacterium]